MKKYLSLALLIPFAVQAGLEETENWQKVGSGTHRMMMMPVYNATLYTPTGQYEREKPLKLAITYRISASAEKLSSRTIDEMKLTNCKHSEFYEDWQQQMTKVFPDVKDGTTVTGVVNDKETIFYLEGKEHGRINGREFQHCFFDVWLKENTSAPKLRASLLGQ